MFVNSHVKGKTKVLRLLTKGKQKS